MKHPHGAHAITWTQAYFVNKQHHRCLLLLKQSDLIEQDVRCRYLAARCLLACEEWEECLQLLGEEGDVDAAMTDGAALGGEVGEAAAYHLLRGRVYQAMDNTTAAVAAFKTALTTDPYCYEVWNEGL